MDTLLTLLGTAGCNFIMGVPGADDVMLHYQSTSFHDALYVRHLLGLKPAPEFEEWLFKMNIMDEHFRLKIFLASIVFYNNQYLKLCELGNRH
jgi:ethanolamine ammonia-lyase large subunit